MPDVELEPLNGVPDPKNHAVFKYNTPIEPIPSQRGDINYVCAHCHAVVIQGISVDINPTAPPPSITFLCYQCGKYNLLRMSFDTYDEMFPAS